MRIFYLLFLCLLAISALADTTVDELLAGNEEPAGVVFEIVSGDDDVLEGLLPAIQKDIERLRQRFPDLAVAIVSHGQEQFSLERKYRDSEPKLHAIAEDIASQDDVDLHVCGAHAGWYGGTPEDYPEYVDVAPSGPARINDYRALGYELILLP